MAATLKEHLESITSAPMAEYYDAVGVTPEVIAQTGKDLLEATIPRTITLKGWFDRTVPMVDGFRVIKSTTSETLIEQLLADNTTRLKAWIEICKQRGLYPTESVSVRHSFDSLVGEVVRDLLAQSKGVPPLPSNEESEVSE